VSTGILGVHDIEIVEILPLAFFLLLHLSRVEHQYFQNVLLPRDDQYADYRDSQEIDFKSPIELGLVYG
jgi:hypothetical protein